MSSDSRMRVHAGPVTALWLAFAAMGAALIHLAVAAGAPPPSAILLFGFGIAELGWGVGVLASGRLLAPRAAPVAALAPVLVWAATVTVGGGPPGGWGGLPFLPMATATLLGILLAGTLAVLHRLWANGSHHRKPPATTTGWRYLGALIVGGVLFSGLVTPALAATDAGRAADPHGTHSVPGPEVSDPHDGSH